MTHRRIAIILAIFLGGFGVHKFYIGKNGQGVIYLLFCWTFIPAILGLVDAIHYARKSDTDFEAKYAGKTAL